MTDASEKQAFRVEHDSMGEVQVPADALWGAQTQRARAHALSGERMPREIIVALTQIKSAAAAVNAELGVIDAEAAQAIQDAARQISAGEPGDGAYLQHFSLPFFPPSPSPSTYTHAHHSN